MKKTIKSRFRVARKSLTCWALAIGLALTEALPHLVDSLPMARDAFTPETYQYIVRATFILGIILRVRREKGGPDAK